MIRHFLCHMINLLCPFRRYNHPIRLNQDFQLDSIWWQELLEMWDEPSFIPMLTWAPTQISKSHQDAAGSLGYSHWFSGAWSD